MEIHRNTLIFGYFSGFLRYFLDFWSNIRVFGENKVAMSQAFISAWCQLQSCVQVVGMSPLSKRYGLTVKEESFIHQMGR